MLHLLASHTKLYPTLNKNKQQQNDWEGQFTPSYTSRPPSLMARETALRTMSDATTDLQTNLEVLDETIWISVRKHLRAPRQTNHSFDTISGT